MSYEQNRGFNWKFFVPVILILVVVIYFPKLLYKYVVGKASSSLLCFVLLFTSSVIVLALLVLLGVYIAMYVRKKKTGQDVSSYKSTKSIVLCVILSLALVGLTAVSIINGVNVSQDIQDGPVTMTIEVITPGDANDNSNSLTCKFLSTSDTQYSTLVDGNEKTLLMYHLSNIEVQSTEKYTVHFYQHTGVYIIVGVL